MGQRATITTPSTSSVAVAFALAAAMRERGVTQSALAEATGTSQPQWSQILAGRKEMTVGQLFAACRFLGVSPGDLAFDEPGDAP